MRIRGFSETFWIFGILAFAVLFALCGTAVAEDPAASSRIIDVKIQGNRCMSDEAVLSHIRSYPGQSYSERIVKSDRQRLLRSGRFKSVVATLERKKAGVILTFVVVERSLVAALSFRGNKKFNDEELGKEVGFGAGDPLDIFTIDAGRRTILLKYRKDGFHFAEVKIDREALKKQNRIVYEIVEGPQVHIREINFEGNDFFGDMSLKFTIESSTNPWWWMFSGGYIDMDRIGRDVQAIRTKYLEEGFLDIEVEPKIAFSDDKSDARLKFHIRENKRYVINRVFFRGNRVFSDAELAKKLSLRQGKFAKTPLIQLDRKKLIETYGRLGYIKTSIRCTRQYVNPDSPMPAWVKKPHDIALINLTFDVREADQYRVGRVDLRLKSAYQYGDTVTLDLICRREITMFPGQLFNTAASAESHRRLM